MRCGRARGQIKQVDHGDVSFLARVVRGLEWVAAEEIARTCSAIDIRLRERGVLFRVPAGGLSSVLDLRAVDDVFLQVAELPAVGRGRNALAALAEGVMQADLPGAVAILGVLREMPPHSPQKKCAFDVVTSMGGNRSYNRFDVEEAVGRQVAARYGWRLVSHQNPRSATTPDVSLRLLLEGERGFLAVRVAARPMHRRPYKAKTGRGTLHPPLASMLTMLAELHPGTRLGDPFCGDGTILVEATQADVRAFGSDLDPARVRNSVENACRARCRIPFVVADAGALPYQDGSWDRVVTNPPWNVGVEAAGRLRGRSASAWRELRRVLRAEGRGVMLVSAGSDVEPQLREARLPVAFEQRVRISGRVGRVLLLGENAGLPARLDAWRQTARLAGVVDAGGF
jgi:tRNA (guanine6-N2)-methyltransferase